MGKGSYYSVVMDRDWPWVTVLDQHKDGARAPGHGRHPQLDHCNSSLQQDLLTVRSSTSNRNTISCIFSPATIATTIFEKSSFSAYDTFLLIWVDFIFINCSDPLNGVAGNGHLRQLKISPLLLFLLYNTLWRESLLQYMHCLGQLIVYVGIGQ